MKHFMVLYGRVSPKKIIVRMSHFEAAVALGVASFFAGASHTNDVITDAESPGYIILRNEILYYYRHIDAKLI